MSNLTAVFDMDIYAYRASSAGEKRTIEAYHPITGDSWKCDTRTQLYGHWIKKDKGILAEHNKVNGTDYKADELVILDKQTPEPIANVLHTVKMMVDSALFQLKTNKMNGYLGKGDSFRVEESTLLKYKGNRTDTLRPLHLPEVREYILKKYPVDLVEGLESDDWLCIDTYRDTNKVCVTADKDAMGTECLVFNPFVNEPKIQDCRGLGKLYLNDKGDVKGYGRKFLFWQILSEDSADNYKANCFSEVSWGAKSAYKTLVDCQTDLEVFKATKDAFQLLYPEPKKITGWREDEIEIDWKYVLDEMWCMARMRRHPTEDNVKATDVLSKFNLLED